MPYAVERHPLREQSAETLAPGQSPRHWAHLDGLRAVAVLAVLVFHINPRWLPGGFVGVDIFFTISGFLITGILIRELNSGQFSLQGFYLRRIRRLLPALWVLLAVCVPASGWILLPEDAEPMAKSALWSVVSMANVYFWREGATDYFSPDAAQFPFLHLWSLGVEEQFYLCWPFIMLACWRVGRQRPVAALSVLGGLVVGVVLLSTALAEWLLARGGERFAYYMLPARAGELALGAGLAVLQASPLWNRVLATSVLMVRLLAVLGWLLIGISLVALSEARPFPGIAALLPTTGAALLIFAGCRNARQLLLQPLQARPTVWVGRLSYSAYLWHWPLLAWWRYLYGEPSAVAGLALLALTLAVASASHQWVEAPFRRSRFDLGMTFVRFVLLPGLVLGGLSVAVAGAQRWDLPLYSAPTQALWAQLRGKIEPMHRLNWACQQHRFDPASLRDPACEFGADKPAVASVLLIGDSQAAAFAPLIRLAAEQQGLRARSIALGSCAPLAGSLIGVVDPGRLRACENGMPQMLEAARAYPVLVIGAAWHTYARRHPAVWERFEALLRLASAAGQRVVLLPGTPVVRGYDARCHMKRVRNGRWMNCPAEFPLADPLDPTNQRLADLASRVPGVSFFDLADWICEAQVCRLTDDEGHYLYADASHLSAHGARLAGEFLLRRGALPGLR